MKEIAMAGRCLGVFVASLCFHSQAAFIFTPLGSASNATADNSTDPSTQTVSSTHHPTTPVSPLPRTTSISKPPSVLTTSISSKQTPLSTKLGAGSTTTTSSKTSESAAVQSSTFIGTSPLATSSSQRSTPSQKSTDSPSGQTPTHTIRPAKTTTTNQSSPSASSSTSPLDTSTVKASSNRNSGTTNTPVETKTPIKVKTSTGSSKLSTATIAHSKETPSAQHTQSNGKEAATTSNSGLTNVREVTTEINTPKTIEKLTTQGTESSKVTAKPATNKRTTPRTAVEVSLSTEEETTATTGSHPSVTEASKASYDMELVIIFGSMFGLMLLTVLVFGIYKLRHRKSQAKFKDGGEDITIAESKF